MKAEAREALLALAESKGGHLKPDDVVEAARDKRSPLHSCFEWDVKKAAMQHWLDTARELIREVRVVINHETVSIRVPRFVEDPSKAPGAQGYVDITKVRTASDEAREVLVREFTHAAGALRRAREIASALDLADEVGALYEGVITVKAKAATV